MTCPVCRSVVPGLACENCLRLAGLRESLTRQLAYLPQVLDDSLELILLRGRKHHIVLFGDHAHTYCGMDTDGVLAREPYLAHGRAFYCPACLEVFDRLCAEVA